MRPLALSTLKRACIQGQEIPNDIPGGLSALRPPIDVDEDGVGTFSVDIRVPEPIEEAEEAEFGVEKDAAAQPEEPGMSSS